MKQNTHTAQTLTLVQHAAEIDDHILMQRVAAEDAAAYRTLVNRHTGRCLRVAVRMLGRRDEAEDIVQEMWLKLWREAPDWEPRAKLSTWLYRVVTNACIDHLRKFKRMQQADMEVFLDDRPAADETLIAGQRAIRVDQAIRRLNKRQRAALVLSYYEGLSGAEVASILNMKVGALQVLLHRTRKELQKELKE